MLTIDLCTTNDEDNNSSEENQYNNQYDPDDWEDISYDPTHKMSNEWDPRFRD